MLRDSAFSKCKTVIGLIVLGVFPIVVPGANLQAQDNICYQPDGIYLPTFKEVDAGSFTMGDSRRLGDPDEQPAQRVVIRTAFEISTCEVTRASYYACVDADVCPEMPTDDCGWSSPPESNWPATLSWNAAGVYIKWLNERPHLEQTDDSEPQYRYSLPTESQWEYASRGDTETLRHWGDDIQTNDANFNSGAPVPADSYNTPRSQSPFELVNTLGNVNEWVQDCSVFSRATGSLTHIDHPLNETARAEASPPCEQVASGYYRIVRGGSYSEQSIDIRSSYRIDALQSDPRCDVGFRVVRVRLPTQ